MANEEQLALLRRGVDAWNEWRRQNPDVRPDLSGAELSGAHLPKADLRGAELSGAYLSEADLNGADLHGANLRGAYLGWARLSAARLHGADLREAYLGVADLLWVELRGADLRGAYLGLANFFRADLRGANLCGANLTGATLVETYLTDADLMGCRVYGISAWDLRLERARQENLIITPEEEPEITVDNLEVAQFIYLLLHNEKIREVIDTIGKKAVLILGRFTPERKAILDTLRDEMRKRDYLPILFDFEKPTSKDLTGTVQTLAHMARFVIADLTDPSCIPHELAMVVPGTVVPVQPVLLEGQREYAVFVDLKRRYGWMLEPYRYTSPDELIGNLAERVIEPAEAKARELRSGQGT